MNEIIAALQDEIEATQRKRSQNITVQIGTNSRMDRVEDARLTGYIQGLNQALYLLTREPVRELDY